MTRPHHFSPEEFLEWNERMAKTFDPDRYHTSSPFPIRWIEGRRVKILLRLLGARSNHHVLEVGVGAGNILEQVRSSHRVGIDVSPFLLAKARARLGEGVTLIEGNAETLTDFVPRRSFDRVYCSEVLEHVQHPDRVLFGIADVLKPDGRAVVSVPNEHMINACKRLLAKTGLLQRFFPSIPLHMEDEWHLHTFGRALLCQVCLPHFDILRIRAVPFPFLPLRYVALLRLKGGGRS